MLTPVPACTARKRLTWAGFNHRLVALGKGGASGWASVDTSGDAFYPARFQAAPSSNGKTTDSDSVNRGSNPRGASTEKVPTLIRAFSRAAHRHHARHSPLRARPQQQQA